MIHLFPPPFLFHTPVDNHSTIQSTLVPLIKEQLLDRTPYQNTYSSYSDKEQPPSYITDDILKDVLWNPFNQLIQEYNFNPPFTALQLRGVWWNYYLPNGYTDPHNHRADDFSFIYLLSCEEPNTTVFQFMGLDCAHYPLTNQPYSTEHIPEGHVIIFPSFLTHWARPSQTNRIVLVGNVTVNF